MKHALKYKSFPFSIKSENDTGLILEGWAAKYGNIDSGNEILKIGCATKTLKERGDRIAFCYQHDIRNPVGKIIELSESEAGLFVRVRISDAEEEIKTKVNEKILREMSIGYREIQTTREVINGKQVDTLTEIMLYEISLVTIAMNEEAIIVNIKSDEQADLISNEFEKLIKTEKNSDKKYELMKLKALVFTKPDNTTLPTKPLTAKEILSYLTN